MELGQLRSFILTAQLQNMSQAARLLGISQPSLSKSITRLEEELGTTLFDRSGKRLILNERGSRFLESVNAAVNELDNAAEDAKSKSADLVINIGLFCPSDGLMRCVTEFSKLYPETSFNIEQLYGSLEHIDTNQYDILLYPRDNLYKRYRGHSAYTERYLLAVNRGNPLAQRSEVSVSDLYDAKLLFLKYGDKEYENVYHLSRNILKGKTGFSFCNSRETHRLMISLGMGVGFIPEGSKDAYAGDDRIALIPIADKEFERDIIIGFKREKHRSHYGQLLIDFITEYMNIKTDS